MKLKRLISFILTSVYLFSVVGVAVIALACECSSAHTHAANPCCHHCTVDLDNYSGAEMASDCCSDHHSLEIELYTRTSSDDEKQSRMVAYALPVQLGVECPCPDHVPYLRVERCESPSPYIDADLLGSVGLRAPPVLA